MSERINSSKRKVSMLERVKYRPVDDTFEPTSPQVSDVLQSSLLRDGEKEMQTETFKEWILNFVCNHCAQMHVFSFTIRC